MDIPTPINAEKVCPRMALRGCPRGDRIALYSKIAEAPKEAISAGGRCACMVPVLLKTAATTARPQNAPINDQKAPSTFPTSCRCSFLKPNHLDTGAGRFRNGDGGITRFKYRSRSRSHSRLRSKNPIMHTDVRRRPNQDKEPMSRNGQRERERDASHSNQTFKKLESNHVKQDSGTGPPI